MSNKLQIIFKMGSSKVKNEFEEIIYSTNSECLAFMKKGIEPLQELLTNIDDWFKKANIAVTEVKENGYTDIDLTVWGENEKLHSENSIKVKNYSVKKSLYKEESSDISEEKSTSKRPRRNASRAASQTIKEQLNIPLNKKVRRPTAVQIKKEKLSSLSEEPTTEPVINNINIKEEINTDEMPASTTKLTTKSRKTKQSSVKIKKEKINEQAEPNKRVTRSTKTSDVIIQEIKQELIEISDSDEEDVPIQTKQSRPIKEEHQQEISGNEEELPAEEKENTIINTSCPEPADETFCLKATDTTFISHSAVNSTVVIEKPTIMPQMQEDLMTDDESEEELREMSPIKPVKKHQMSPVKKKVEDFERLHEEAPVTRVTRTKTRALAKEQNDEAAAAVNNEVVANESSVDKEKVKMFTPKDSKFLPKACSTQTSNRIRSNSTDTSITKSASALKASQAEFRERERRRKEKEEEALKKREALILSQMEERKRKREEKQLKVQKQRELLLEKEKQKALEALRLKEERNNKLLAEQNEKKRLMAAKMRAAEEKRRAEEEQRKMNELNGNKLEKNNDDEEIMMKTSEKLNQQRPVPIYMKVPAPLLPTDDCYDSDNEEHRDEKRYVPKWADSSVLKQQQLLTLALGEKIKNTFFSIQGQTADLQEIFEVIAPMKLKRSSSACWHKPPRFTMLPPDLDLHQEDSNDDCE